MGKAAKAVKYESRVELYLVKYGARVLLYGVIALLQRVTGSKAV